MTLLRKLGLILWKNLLLRKRRYILTTLEFIFPILPLIIVVYISIVISVFGPYEGSPNLQPHIVPEYNIHQPGWCHSSSSNLNPENTDFIAYTPDNPQTAQIIRQASENICNNPSDTTEDKKNFVGWVPVASENELEDKYQSEWRSNDKFHGAVVFSSVALNTLYQSGSGLGSAGEGGPIPYTIRMKPAGFPSTKHLLPVPNPSSDPFKRTDFTRCGPNKVNEGKYLKTGFLALQLSLDKAFANLLTSKTFIHKISIQGFPYPPFKGSGYGYESDQKVFLLMLVFLPFTLALSFIIPSIIGSLVGEKQSGITELLRMTGIPVWIQWLGWLIPAVIPSLITITVVVPLLIYGVRRDYTRLAQADPTLLWILLFLSVLAAAAFIFFLCALFQKPIIATTVIELVWLGSLITGIVVPIILRDGLPFGVSIILQFLPNYAMATVLTNAAMLEYSWIDDSDLPAGARWSNIHIPVKPTLYSKIDYQNGLSNLHVMLMLLTDIILYTVLAIYFDGVLPSEYGVRRPWTYFNFKRAKGGSVAEDEATIGGDESTIGGDDKTNSRPNFEEDPVGAVVGIDIRNLVKRFGPGKVAVNGVSLRMFSGDIFALLGHNGAGKTTLISMLTGFVTPTEGTAIINGYDIRKDMDKARESMGLCPQQNMLFDKLTALQHLCLFGRLRGLSNEQAKNAASTLLARMSFLEKWNIPANKLSGGQKRKLCLGMALIGGTKVVVLDEPTSGMDPQARREIWDLLLELRGERTILLTTHFMEEADVLGDRIGIMANGMLQCCGTAAFLKKYYGAGHTLKLTLGKPMEISQPLEIKLPVEIKPPVEISQPMTEKEKEWRLRFHALGYAVSVHKNSKDGTLSNPVPPLNSTGPAVDKKMADAILPQKILSEKILVDTSLADKMLADKILAVVRKYIPTATFKTNANFKQTNNEVFFTLPAEGTTTTALNQMFADLSEQRGKLGILTIGLSETTMDEVFVRVGDLVEVQASNVKMIPSTQLGMGDHVPPEEHQEDKEGQWSGPTTNEVFEKAPKVTKNLFLCQYTALMMKKYTFMKRRWIMLIFETLIPLALFVTVIHLTNSFAEPIPLPNYYPNGTRMRSGGRSGGSPDKQAPNTSIPIMLDVYKNPVTLFYEDGGLPSLSDSIGPSAKRSSTYLEEEVLNVAKRNRIAYKRRHIVAVKATDSDILAMFNLYPYHAAPLAINVATNALLKHLNPNANYHLQVTNHPFFDEIPEGPSSHDRSARQFDYDNDDILYTKISRNEGKEVKRLVPYMITFALLIFTANFIVIPIEERLCKAKQLQTMTGVTPAIYWGAAFTWDYCFYFLIILYMLIYLIIFDFMGYAILVSDSGWLIFFLIAMSYGFSATIFAYLFSLRASSVAGGFTLVTMVHLLIGFLCGCLIPDPDDKTYAQFIVPISAVETLVGIIKAVARLCPTFSLVRALYKYVKIAVDNSNCRLLGPQDSDCPEPKPYLKWSTMTTIHRFEMGTFTEVDYKVPELGQEIFFILVVGLIYGILLLLIEYGIFRKIGAKVCAGKAEQFPQNVGDEDVFLETERVNALVSSEEVGENCLTVQNLSKSFGDFAAVSRLHFGVYRGECFGLLGVNGAGKTTAFRMITGDEMPSMGNAFGFGTSLNTDSRRFLSNIGYCPQFDALLECFTGKEMLELFAGLRGVPYKMRGNEAMKWLIRMGLMESANVKCGRYSGGMKRRLITAMAMIGDPDLILLDEPTSGVDPVSRRQFWKILDKMRESGQSIILTSHSMEECEALCSRLGIMVNGQFQCFGGVQHLKNKFAQGYSLTLKLKDNLAFGSAEVEAELAKIHEKVCQLFEPCELKDKHQNLLQYHLQNPTIKWESLFKTMEEVKKEFVNFIEDFTVNETSLEEVFLAFARLQYPERRANVSLCKKICTCSC